VVFRDEILNIRGLLEAELIEIGRLDRPDAAFARDK
jgi:hypothetical protein